MASKIQMSPPKSFVGGQPVDSRLKIAGMTDKLGIAKMEKDHIFIKGAREHNLQGIDLKIARNAMVVFTGLSGSGKSSLAFDTIYAEGQRRYVESLSAYER